MGSSFMPVALSLHLTWKIRTPIGVELLWEKPSQRTGRHFTILSFTNSVTALLPLLLWSLAKKVQCLENQGKNTASCVFTVITSPKTRISRRGHGCVPVFVCEQERGEMPTGKDAYMYLQTCIHLYQNRISQENLGALKWLFLFQESRIDQPERTTVGDQRDVM